MWILQVVLYIRAFYTLDDVSHVCACLDMRLNSFRVKIVGFIP